MTPIRPQIDDGDAAPPGLVHALQRLDEAAGGCPGSVADEVLGAARRRFAQRRRLRALQRVVGAAAVIGMVLGAVWLTKPASRPMSSGLAALPGDADGSGRIDMLDALIVRNGVEQRATQNAWDVNRDGVVDQADVALIAVASVRLDERSVHP